MAFPLCIVVLTVIAYLFAMVNVILVLNKRRMTLKVTTTVISTPLLLHLFISEYISLDILLYQQWRAYSQQLQRLPSQKSDFNIKVHIYCSNRQQLQPDGILILQINGSYF